MSRHVALLAPQVGRDGGVAAHVLDSAAALRAAGHAVTLMCARSEYALEGVESVTYVDAGDAAAVEATLRSCAPDVVHLHDYADPDVVEVVRRVAPAVLSAHAYPGCTPNTHYFAAGVECDRPHGPGCVVNMALRGCLHARDPRPVPRRYRQASRRMAAYAQADGVVCYSTAIARHLRRNGFDPQRVPLFTTLESVEHAMTRDGEPADGSQVLFVGRVVAEKGLHVLLQALAPVDATLTVVGDGLALPAARRQAADLRMSARVEFEGWLSGAALAAAYRRAAVVAVPSVWPEPFGLVGLEAMAASKPVVGKPDRRDRRLAGAEGHGVGRAAGQRGGPARGARHRARRSRARAGDGGGGSRFAGCELHGPHACRSARGGVRRRRPPMVLAARR